MLNKKYKNKIIFPLVILIIGVFFSIKFFNKNIGVVSIPEIQKVNSSVNLMVDNINLVENIKNQKENIKEKEIKTINTFENFVTLNVLDQNYKIEIEEGDTVYDAMQTLDNSTNNFSFSSKEYSGLGVFINEINGVKGKSGAYWIYYVNSKEASVGVSKYVLKSGNIITWKQE